MFETLKEDLSKVVCKGVRCSDCPIKYEIEPGIFRCLPGMAHNAKEAIEYLESTEYGVKNEG